MRIKKQYTRDQLEAWPVRKIKRTFAIARQAMFTKMRLIDKVMKRMNEVYPEVKYPDNAIYSMRPDDKYFIKPEADNAFQSMSGYFDTAMYPVYPKVKEKEVVADTDIPWQTRIVEQPKQEQLQNTKWLELLKLYGIPVKQGINKQKAIEMILTGELKLKQ